MKIAIIISLTDIRYFVDTKLNVKLWHQVVSSE